MATTTTQQYNRRAFERFELPAMHTSVAVRRDRSETALSGHAYDISEQGVRLELDEPLQSNESVLVEIDLPGAREAIHVAGRVVWMTDEHDDPGPRRIALTFSSFVTADDRIRLLDYLARGGLPRAA